MKKINNFLQIFAKIQAPDIKIRKTFKSLIKEEYDFGIDLSQIKVSNNTIFYNAPSSLKQEIKLNEKNIIQKINQSLNIKIRSLI